MQHGKIRILPKQTGDVHFEKRLEDFVDVEVGVDFWVGRDFQNLVKKCSLKKTWCENIGNGDPIRFLTENGPFCPILTSNCLGFQSESFFGGQKRMICGESWGRSEKQQFRDYKSNNQRYPFMRSLSSCTRKTVCHMGLHSDLANCQSFPHAQSSKNAGNITNNNSFTGGDFVFHVLV